MARIRLSVAAAMKTSLAAVTTAAAIIRRAVRRVSNRATQAARRVESFLLGAISRLIEGRSAAEEGLDQLKRRLRLLLLRHVTAILDQTEGRIWQRAPELKAHAERHDTIVVAP